MRHDNGCCGRSRCWAVVLAAACALWPGVAAPPGEAQTTLPKAIGTFTYWGGLIFSEEANNMLVDRIKQWGQERGIPVDVVMINQNETVQRVSAAIEAGTMPDALDMGRDLMLLLSQNNKLEAVDDVYDADRRGAWRLARSADPATTPRTSAVSAMAIPFGTSGNLLNRRDDVLSRLALPKRRRPGKSSRSRRLWSRSRRSTTAWALRSPTSATAT